MTISTVGYGDISPSPDVGMRTFTVLFILVGSGYAFSELANALDGVLEAFTIRVKRFLKRTCGRDRTAETGDGTAGQKVTGRSLGIGGVSLDLDGDGTADFIQPPRAFVFWAQELLPAFLLLMRCLRVQKVPHARVLRPIPSQGLSLRSTSLSAPVPDCAFTSPDILAPYMRLTCAPWSKRYRGRITRTLTSIALYIQIRQSYIPYIAL